MTKTYLLWHSLEDDPHQRKTMQRMTAEAKRIIKEDNMSLYNVDAFVTYDILNGVTGYLIIRADGKRTVEKCDSRFIAGPLQSDATEIDGGYETVEDFSEAEAEMEILCKRLGDNLMLLDLDFEEGDEPDLENYTINGEEILDDDIA